MWRVEAVREIDDALLVEVEKLLVAAEAAAGFRQLSDHLWLDLANREPGVTLAIAREADGELVAVAELAPANESTAIEVLVGPGVADPVAVTAALLDAALDIVARRGGGTVNWWVHHPESSADAIAATAGLHLGRRLLQMRCSLPLEQHASVPTRSFVVGVDEPEWLRVNNAAFHDHPEQGGWTLETLHQREAERWFDPDGFRLHDRDGRLAAFCWTKVHADESPLVGEIYVIAVDPTFHGLGLGRQLTLAGLDHLAGCGITIGMLHVDAANEAAMTLYTSLGFTVHQIHHAYLGHVPAR
jgi:mycothiol synthase